MVNGIKCPKLLFVTLLNDKGVLCSQLSLLLVITPALPEKIDYTVVNLVGLQFYWLFSIRRSADRG